MLYANCTALAVYFGAIRAAPLVRTHALPPCAPPPRAHRRAAHAC